MPNPHCVISRVRMKDGGADVHVLGRNVADLSPRAAQMVDYARRAITVLQGDIAGFVIVAWDPEGLNTVGADMSGQNLIPRSLLPSWVADVVRRELVTAPEIREIVNTEYVTDRPPLPPGA